MRISIIQNVYNAVNYSHSKFICCQSKCCTAVVIKCLCGYLQNVSLYFNSENIECVFCFQIIQITCTYLHLQVSQCLERISLYGSLFQVSYSPYYVFVNQDKYGEQLFQITITFQIQRCLPLTWLFMCVVKAPLLLNCLLQQEQIRSPNKVKSKQKNPKI